MRWKEFWHYQSGQKTAIIALLVLVVLSLILNMLFSQYNRRNVILVQNDSLVRAFDEFRQNLTVKEKTDYPQRDFQPKTDYRQSYSQKPKADKPSANYTPFPKTDKLAAGETISLNETDTAAWKKIPGIGTSFAKRIVAYREKLGGFASVEQLREVYGVDAEMFSKIAPYIQPDANFRKIEINKLEFKQLLAHPYLNYKQVQAIVNLRKKKGSVSSVSELAMLDEFTSEDIERLTPYLAF